MAGDVLQKLRTSSTSDGHWGGEVVSSEDEDVMTLSSGIQTCCGLIEDCWCSLKCGYFWWQLMAFGGRRR